MKRARILSFLLSAALLPLASPAAVDVGGALDSLTAFSSGDPLLSQTGRLTLWMGAAVGERTDFYLQAGARLSTDDPLFVADLDRLFLKGGYPTGMGAGPAILKLTLGRDVVTDFSGLLLSHPLDGISIGLGYAKVSAELFLAYSGLVLKPSSRIQMSREDYRDEDLEEVYFGSKRLFGGVSIRFPELFSRQQLDLSLVFQEDLRPLLQDDLPQEGDTVEKPGRGGPLDTQYAGLGLRGSIRSNLFYDSFVYVGTGRTLNYIDTGSGYAYEFSTILSFLAGLGFRYYLEPILFSKIELALALASGDGDFSSFPEGNTTELATAFMPLSQETLGLVFTPLLSNLVRAKASYSLKPFSRLNASALRQFVGEIALLSYFRPTEGPISESGMDPGASGYYIGTEIDLSLSYRPFSDLFFDLSGGVFLPNRDIFVSGEEKPEYKVALKITLGF